MIDLAQVCLRPTHTLREAMECINKNTKGVALVVDSERRLVCTITDGDLRRAVLNSLNLDMTIEAWAAERAKRDNLHPTTAPLGTQPSELLRLMRVSGFRHIPLVDNQGRVADLALLSDFMADSEMSSLNAVVMAGGYGKRLRPLTERTPKPMLPVGGEPILKLIIKELRKAGIRKINISTHYKAEKITEHFGDGSSLGVQIHYLLEDQPLGTAGILGSMRDSSQPLLVINGDIITKVDFRSMFTFHQEQHADMTVAVQKYDVNIAYGVVQTEGTLIRRIVEKPKFEYFVNAGIYLIEPAVLKEIPESQRVEMSDLIEELLKENRRVVSFPVREYWLDIGNPSDYEQAKRDIKKGRLEK